jgi:DNA-binding XRE family transcriptional regulator
MGKRKETKRYTQGTSFEAVRTEQLKDPEFEREYQALGPEFEVIEQILALRIKRGLTQRQLAERVGTQQPSIARLERRRGATDLNFLRRVAQALDARLEIRLVPLSARGRNGKRKMTA